MGETECCLFKGIKEKQLKEQEIDLYVMLKERGGEFPADLTENSNVWMQPKRSHSALVLFC